MLSDCAIYFTIRILGIDKCNGFYTNTIGQFYRGLTYLRKINMVSYTLLSTILFFVKKVAKKRFSEFIQTFIKRILNHNINTKH